MSNTSASSTADKVSVRFIVDKSHQYVTLFDRSTTFKQIETLLRDTKPQDLFTTEAANELSDYQLKFIYSGKIFNPSNTIWELEKTQSKYPLNVQIIKLKKSTQQPQQTNNSNVNNSQPQQQQQQEELNFHVHGCLFDIDEFKQVEQIFNSKENHDNHTVDLGFLNSFLHSYWNFLISRHPALVDNSPSFNSNSTRQSVNNNVNNNNNSNSNNSNNSSNSSNSNDSNSRPFPTEKLSKILRTVLKVSSLDGQTLIDKEQFRIIFYLFTSDTDNHACPSGSKESVKRMIEQYHVTLDTTQSFDNDLFNSIYHNVEQLQDQEQQQSSQQQQQNLTCQNIELLFYLYTAHVYLQRDKLSNNQQHQQQQQQQSSSGTPSS